MKLQSLSLYNISKSGFSSNKPAFRASNKHKAHDTLPSYNQDLSLNSINGQIKLEDEFFESFLEKPGKVTQAQYESILKKHPRTLARSYEVCDKIPDMQSTPNDTARFALALKKYYDDTYGNYTVLSLGTSPACVCEVMQNIGAKVVFMPISGVRSEQLSNPLYVFRNIFPTAAKRNDNIEILMNYCTKMGLGKKQAGDILILDFVCSGNTLFEVEKLLKRRGDIKDDKIHSHPILWDLNSIARSSEESNTYKITKSQVSCLEHDMRKSLVANITNVPHFYVKFGAGEHYKNAILTENKTERKIFREFDDFSLPEARAWALCATHEAYKLSKDNIS